MWFDFLNPIGDHDFKVLKLKGGEKMSVSKTT